MNGWDNVIAAFTSKEECEKLVLHLGSREEHRIRSIALENVMIPEDWEV
jgi:hypothetical protein